MVSVNVVRGYPGSGRTRYALSLGEMPLRREAPLKEAPLKEAPERSQKTTVVILAATRTEKERLRLKTLHWPRPGAAAAVAGAQIRAVVHNCHSLALSWFGKGTTDADLASVTSSLTAGGINKSSSNTQDLAAASSVHFVLAHGDGWRHTLCWTFLTNLIHFLLHVRQKSVSVTIVGSPWMKLPPAAFLHQCVLNDRMVLQGSRWLPPQIAALAWMVQHHGLAQLWCGDNDPIDHVDQKPFSLQVSPRSDLLPSLLDLPDLTLTVVEQWTKQLQPQPYRDITVLNADTLPRSLLLEIICHCTRTLTLCRSSPSSASQYRTSSSIPRHNTPSSISVSEWLKRLTGEQIDTLAKRHVRVINMRTEQDAAQLNLLTANQSLLQQHRRTCPAAVVGHTLPLLLQTQIFRTHTSFADVWKRAVQFHQQKNNKGSRSMGSTERSRFRVNHQQPAQQRQQRRTTDRFAMVKDDSPPPPPSAAADQIEHCCYSLCSWLYRTLRQLWAGLAAISTSEQQQQSLAQQQTTLPPFRATFEREISTMVDPKLKLCGRIDISLGDHADVVIELKCKQLHISTKDILQLALYQAMSRHQHAVLIDVLRGTLIEIEALDPAQLLLAVFVL